MQAILDKLLSNTSFALVLSGAFLVLVAAAGGFPLLTIQVSELEWRIALAALGVLFAGGGLFIWWREKPGRDRVAVDTPTRTAKQEVVLEKIAFDYPDLPTQHGWRVSETEDASQPTFRHFEDGFFGSAVEIKSAVRYAMDYDVKPVARLGSLVQFAAMPANGHSVLYAHVNVRSSDGSRSRPVWLRFALEKRDPYPLADGSQEWTVPVKRAGRNDAWLLFRVDLDSAVMQTFGKNGWAFQQLTGFRVRGTMSLAHISVSGEL